MRSLLEDLSGPEITDEMIAHYERRTRRHIGLVQRFSKLMVSGDPMLWPLMERSIRHDATKWAEPERTPYIWLTWRYKCKDDGVECVLPNGMEERIREATLHHILTNAHHPESHLPEGAERDRLLNDKDRDGIPDEVIDATGMGYMDLGEMVADWCAMSKERGNTPREWADKVVGKRWGFTQRQEGIIYRMIDLAWGI